MMGADMGASTTPRREPSPPPPAARRRVQRSGGAGAAAAGPLRRRPSTKAWWRPLRWLVMAVVWGGLAGSLLLLWFAWDMPRPEAALATTRRPSVRLLAADGALLATEGDLYGEMVRLRDLPPFLPAALLAVEDRRFRSHFGLDPIGIARAAWANWRAGDGGAGRLHPHPAARQEPVPDARALHPPQGAGGAAGAVAGAPLQQGPAARDLPEPRLSRRRGLWRGRGGAALLRRPGAAAAAVAGGDAGRAAQGALPPQPARLARPRRRAGGGGAGRDGG